MQKRTGFIIFVVFAAQLFGSVSLFAGTLILKSGQKVEGEIIKKTDTFVRIEENGIPVTYFNEEISQVIETPQDQSAEAPKPGPAAINPAPVPAQPPEIPEVAAAQPSGQPIPDHAEILDVIKNLFMHQNDRDQTQALSSFKSKLRPSLRPAMEAKVKRNYAGDTTSFDNFKLVDFTADGTAGVAKISFTMNAVRSFKMEKDGTGWKIAGFMEGSALPEGSNPAKTQ